MICCTEGVGPLSVQFPALSDEEKRSPIGALLCYVMGNFMSLNEMVMKNREATSHKEILSIAHKPNNSSSVASKQSPQHQDSGSTKEETCRLHQILKGIDSGACLGNPNTSENPDTRDACGIPYLPNSTDIIKEHAHNIQSPLENIIHSLPPSYNHQTVKRIHQQPLSLDDPNNAEYPVASLPIAIDIIKELNEDIATKSQKSLENLMFSLSASSASLSSRYSQRLAQPTYDNETEGAPLLILNKKVPTDKQ